MDFVGLKKRISDGIAKYKYAWIVLLVGIVLMMIPGKSGESTVAQETEPAQVRTEDSIEEKLEDILCHVKGAGKVQVMLTVSQGERTLYQTDSSYSQGETSTDTRTQTILITDSQRNETGLVHQKNPPIYQGAIVLTQGADDPVVKLAIVDAVSNVTGLGADKISVLKMQ